MVSDRANACPMCGYPVNNRTYAQPQRQGVANQNYNNNRKNSSFSVAIWSFLIALGVGAIIYFLAGPGCRGSSTNTSHSNTPTKLQSGNVGNKTSRSTNNASSLTEYVVKSYGGYGLYLRNSPRSSAKTDIVYRDGTHLYGHNSDTPGWICVVENGQVVGYLPAEKVIPVDEYYSHQSQVASSSPLTEYVVKSYGGYGLYLRSSPRSGATTQIVYRDGTHFYGRYSGTPGWISVVESERVVGYLPEEKVYEY